MNTIVVLFNVTNLAGRAGKGVRFWRFVCMSSAHRDGTRTAGGTRAYDHSTIENTLGHGGAAMQASLALPRDDNRPDAQVVAALAQQARDDPTLFTPLYKRYRDPIYRYLRARVSRDEDAADLTQQVFLQALEHLHQYQVRKGSFAAWLFAIARHAATNSHRRPPSVAWDYLPPARQATETDTTEMDVLQRERVARITQLMESLPIAKRELLVLRFVSGLTIPDIAAVLGKSTEAARKELRRTLHTLKERYDDPTI